jgi:hypothetical protein
LASCVLQAAAEAGVPDVDETISSPPSPGGGSGSKAASGTRGKGMPRKAGPKARKTKAR